MDAVAVAKIRKKWIAKLIDRKGKLVRTIPIPWSTPPNSCLGFFEFEKGILQYGGDSVKPPRRRFNRSKIIRSDARITIIEYQEVLVHGFG